MQTSVPLQHAICCDRNRTHVVNLREDDDMMVWIKYGVVPTRNTWVATWGDNDEHTITLHPKAVLESAR